MSELDEPRRRSNWKDASEHKAAPLVPVCPHCDCPTLQPERDDAGRWVCPCCARVFGTRSKTS